MQACQWWHDTLLKHMWPQLEQYLMVSSDFKFYGLLLVPSARWEGVRKSSACLEGAFATESVFPTLVVLQARAPTPPSLHHWVINSGLPHTGSLE